MRALAVGIAKAWVDQQKSEIRRVGTDVEKKRRKKRLSHMSSE